MKLNLKVKVTLILLHSDINILRLKQSSMSNQTKNIRLLTYNVFLRPPPIKTNEDDYKHQRLNDILDQIGKYDIVCFQELFQTATFRKQKVIDKAISKGFFYWKQCEAPLLWSGPPVDSGLLVISKFPILDSVFESYCVGILSDAASDKGYIYCKISINNNILHLFTTHLQASYLHPGMLYQRQLSIKTRLYQFRTLLIRIKSILAETRKNPQTQLVLLMGDLNMNALMVPLTLDGNGSVLESQKVGQKFIEYESFMKIFKDAGIKPTNCGYEKYTQHPITFGDGDTVLTDRLQSLSKQSLDFIFSLDVPVQLQEKSIKNSKSNLKQKYQKTEQQLKSRETSDERSLKPIIQSAKVEEFKIKDRPYIQLSDHYGMSIEISIQ